MQHTDSDDDRIWAWVVLVGGFMVHMIVDGVSLSFGLYVQPFLEHFQLGRTELGFLGSIFLSVRWFAGPLSRWLMYWYGFRVVVISGTLIGAVGLIMSIFAQSIWFLYFTYGFLGGLGLGIMYMPSVVAVSSYFIDKRSFMVRLSMFGSGVGTCLFVPINAWLINEVGWRGALLIETGVLLNGFACGALFRPRIVPVSYQYIFNSSSRRWGAVDNQLSRVFASPAPSRHRVDRRAAAAGECAANGELTSASPRFSVEDIIPDGEEELYASISLSSCSLPVHGRRPSTSGLQQRCLFTGRVMVFLLYFSAMILAAIGFSIIYVFVADRLVLLDRQPKDRAAILLSAIGLSQAVGRLLLGYATGRAYVSGVAVLWMSLFLAGVSTFLSVFCTIFATIVACWVLVGLFIGASLFLVPEILSTLMETCERSSSVDISLLFGAIGAMIGPPLAGLLYDITLNYDYSFYVVSCSFCLSGCLLCILKCIH